MPANHIWVLRKVMRALGHASGARLFGQRN
jgi:hypothetical protein